MTNGASSCESSVEMTNGASNRLNAAYYAINRGLMCLPSNRSLTTPKAVTAGGTFYEINLKFCFQH